VQTSRARRRLRGKLLLLVGSIVVALGIAEVVLRVRTAMLRSGERFLVWSSPHFEMTENAAVRYVPSERVRTLAVYRGDVAYDVTYETNNWGYIDHRDYPLPDAERVVLLLGDSFTAGVHGGKPWVPVLGEVLARRHGVAVYNLGVTGTSIENMRRLLELESKRLHATDIVLLPISDDLGRVPFYPLVEHEELRFCYEQYPRDFARRYEDAFAKIVPIDRSQEEIIAVGQEWLRRDDVRVEAGTIGALLGKSELFRVVHGEILKLQSKAYGRPGRDGTAELNLDALRQIGAAYAQCSILLIQPPQKSEMQGYRYDFRADADQAGMRYVAALQESPWGPSHYHTSDGHPTLEGYTQLACTVARALGYGDDETLDAIEAAMRAPKSGETRE
jgi:hypothetical protein